MQENDKITPVQAADRAFSLFTAVPRQHNCAQSVVCGCGRDDWKDEMQDCGGGRAPGGLCGALHGAITLNPEKRDEILTEFKKKLGGLTCAELKGSLHVPCTACVRLAAMLAKK